MNQTDQTALIVVDVQRGFDDAVWGSRNNPACEANIAALVQAWRARGWPVVYVRHDSRNSTAPLAPGQSGNDFKAILTGDPDLLISKQVNSAFYGTPSLDAWLTEREITSVAICGITTNHCCETTARMAGNLGYATWFILDATHTFDRHDLTGQRVSADELARITAANLEGEFATVVETQAVLQQARIDRRLHRQTDGSRSLPAPELRAADVQRLSAFTLNGCGGNPAGVHIGRARLPDEAMQRVAREVGYSETAFLTMTGDRSADVRYFSPEREVPFCGHATIASAVALAEMAGLGPVVFETKAGQVLVDTGIDDDGLRNATLTSVATQVEGAAPSLVREILDALRWTREDLDGRLPPALAYAGAWHLVVGVSPESLSGLDYDMPRLTRIMLEADLTTLQLVSRDGRRSFRARDPFPVGGVYEDAATGAAAAALGAYLRARGELIAPDRFLITQGVEMGAPSRLIVSIEPRQPGVRVTGVATALR